MKIIKIELETSLNGKRKVIKQAVSLDRKHCKDVRAFVEHVKKVCEVQGNYVLEIDGFEIPQLQNVRMLQESRVYRMRIDKSGRSKILQILQEDSQLQEQSVQEDSSEEIQQSQSQEAVPLKKAAIVKPVKPQSKVQQKQVKQVNKKAILKPQQPQDSSDSQESSQSEVVPKKRVKQDSTPKVKPIIKPVVKQDKAPKAMIETVKNNRIIKKVACDSSESDSDEESDQLPQLKNSEPKKVIPVAKPQVKKPIKKTVLVNASSESQSQPSPERKTDKKQIEKPVFAVEKAISVVKSTQSAIKLPPALRNARNPPAKHFQTYQENQWVSLDKEKLKKWNQKGHKIFCQPPNKIRFKVIEFDEQKFIPVKSNWIKGSVQSVQENGKVHMVDVDEEGKSFMKKYELHEHNMDELQIWKPLATKEQLEVLQNKTISIVAAQQPQVKEADKAQKQQEESKVVSKQSQGQSVEKFICGQVNYYFSDKNYHTDFYMQLHANSHPQKYLNLSFLLNFPKIKKAIRDEDKLYEYLRGDDKYESRTYEIDFQNKLIRKKNIIDPREAHSGHKQEQTIAQKAEKNPDDSQNVEKDSAVVNN